MRWHNGNQGLLAWRVWLLLCLLCGECSWQPRRLLHGLLLQLTVILQHHDVLLLLLLLHLHLLLHRQVEHLLPLLLMVVLHGTLLLLLLLLHGKLLLQVSLHQGAG